ncbi:MAG: SocA family protein, partial [Candidatus Hydrogenedentes bacterium]|nr:SocA family protein [Candidatus Hydrogenedentota bacterium]
MSFHFSPMKAIQCVCWLLDKFPNKRHNYTCVLKLLYLADRESMILARTPITGDIPCALDKGPLLSHIYDLVKGDVDEETQAL